jgi:DNA-binding NarL/FixJ family response regulator
MAELFQEKVDVAHTHLRLGLVGCREHGEAHCAALALIGLAALAVAHGDGDRSMELLAESLDAASAIPDARLAGIMSGWVSINLAVTARTTGDGQSAEQHIEEALVRFRAEQFDVGIMMALGDLGDLARDRSDWERALSLYKEALVVGRNDQAKRIVIEILESVAVVAVHSAQLEDSAVLLGAAENWSERIGLGYRHPRNRSSLEQAIDTTRRGLPAEAFEAAWERGQSLTFHQAIGEVLDFNRISTQPDRYSLTARETEVLHLLAKGMTDPEIADALFISVRTVEHHVAGVFRKLEVRTRTAATSTAIAAGLVSATGSA